uniref:PPM-type phosphatase domain-containing protein n=1 Tax=Alexandrium monilatum TaxID=311494 RepID=A0A6T0SCZ3_9DINO
MAPATSDEFADDDVKAPEHRNNAWLHAGACTAKGLRDSNEDQHLLLSDWCPIPEWPAGLFAVLDGHGGPAVAILASKLLPLKLKAELEAEVDGTACWRHPKLRRAAVQRAFLALDAQLGSKAVSQRSGSTCVAAIVWPEDGGGCRVLLANLGDSRGLIVCGPGSGVPNLEPGGLVKDTVDHRPDAPQEEARIMAAGGLVWDDFGPARVDGDLAMSRAFGDFRLKGDDALPPEEQKVSPMPDVYEFACFAGDVVVLACDGAFDVMTSHEAARLAYDELVSTGGSPASAAQEVVLHSLRLGTMDNVTCVVLQQHSAMPGSLPEPGAGPPEPGADDFVPR